MKLNNMFIREKWRINMNKKETFEAKLKILKQLVAQKQLDSNTLMELQKKNQELLEEKLVERKSKKDKKGVQ